MTTAHPTVAIVLAAGVGSRLRPFTDTMPKCLVPVGTRSILARAVSTLRASGVERFVVSTGYRAAQIRAALEGVDAVFVDNPDYESTQNVVSFARALEHVRTGERLIKLDGDVVFESTVLARLFGATGSAVAVETNPNLGTEEMKVRVEHGRIVEFGKGIDPKHADGESIGIECFVPDDVPPVVEAIRGAVSIGRTGVYYEDVYNDVLERATLRAVPVRADEWMEIDDPADLEAARRRFGRTA